MLRVLFLFLGVISLTSCFGPRYGDFFLYDDDGIAKPKIAFLPIISWHKTDGVQESYLKESIVTQVRENGTLFLYSDDEIQHVLDRCKNINDFEMLSSYFRPADFVVEALILQDACIPSKCFTIPGIRNNPLEHVISVRLQIIDIRTPNPKVIIFEIIEEREIVVTRENYRKSPSIIYEKLAEKISNRLIGCAGCL